MSSAPAPPLPSGEAARGLLPERLGPQAEPEPGQGVWVVYGPGTADDLIGQDLMARWVDETLWLCLRGLGFERIVFSSARLPVFFRDEHSAALCDPSARQAPGPLPRRLRFVRPGPLGNWLVTPENAAAGVAGIGAGSGCQTPAPGPSASAPRAPQASSRLPVLSDSARIQTLSWLMSDDSARTAVVLLETETIVHNFNLRDRPELATAFAGWLSGRTGRGNVCVLVSDQSSLADFAELIDGEQYLKALATHLTRLVGHPEGGDSRALRVGYPEQDEIARLVQRARLRDGLRVDWAGYATALRQLAARPGMSARRWREEFARLARDGLVLSADTLRARGLITSTADDGRPAESRLGDLTGLEPVKAFLTRRRKRIQADVALGVSGRLDAGAPHLVFLGNPGTGKTTVARLVGEIYRDLGLLARGHVVECTRADLVAEHVGGTARLTRQRVLDALDGILFIDEAYQLLQGDDVFGREAVETLLSEMENHRHRLVVIVAGYPGPMREFLTANPGLPSRFPERNRVEFSDYTPEELLSILRSMLAGRGLHVADDDPMCQVLRNVVTGMHASTRRTFGNARDMRELADEVIDGWAERTSPVQGQPLSALQPQDVPARLQQFTDSRIPTEEEVLAELDHLIGLAPVKNFIRQLSLNRKLALRRGQAASPAPHIVLGGSPGTGKTTVARILGRLFAAMGLLRSGHLVQVTRSDLVAGYVGQTAMKIRKKVEDALDGVLFIDEAYSLSEGLDGDFGAEALYELTAMMDDHRGSLIVIAAGYSDRMERFLEVNEGLASRFGLRLEFPDYELPELVSIFTAEAARRGYALAEGTISRAARWLHHRKLARGQSFGNARDVRVLLDQMELNLAQRLGPGIEEITLETASRLTMADVPGLSE